jgi:hypothetical protein
MRVQNIFDIALFESGLIETVLTDTKPHALSKNTLTLPKPQKTEQGFVYQALNSLGLPIMHILTT